MNRTLINWALGLLTAVLIGGATALASNLNSNIANNQEKIENLAHEQTSIAVQNARIEQQLIHLNNDLQRVLVILEN